MSKNARSEGDGVYDIESDFTEYTGWLEGDCQSRLCVLNVDGKTAATTADGLEEYLPQARAFVDSPADSQEVQGNQFFKIYDEQQLEYILIVGGCR